MTENQTANQATAQENKPSDKELNFRALETRYRKELDQERQARLELERQINDIKSSKNQHSDEDDSYSEPYVDDKRLDKKLSSFERKMEEKIDKKAEEKAMRLLQRREEEDWLKNNSDFAEVLNEENLNKFLTKAPAMAESIKRMPDGFEKQKLVYNAIKSMGIDKPEPKQPSVQDRIDANKRSPYYQPSGVGSAPYAMAGDFSPSGQKNAYNKMKELQARLRG